MYESRLERNEHNSKQHMRVCTDVQWGNIAKTVAGGVDNIQLQEVVGGGQSPSFSSDCDAESSAPPPEPGSGCSVPSPRPVQ